MIDWASPSVRRLDRRWQDALLQAGLRTGAARLPVAQQPVVLPAEQFAEVSAAVQAVHGALERLATAFREDRRLHRVFPEYLDLAEVIARLPGYRPLIRVARIDGAVDEQGTFRVFDINTACPGGVLRTPMVVRSYWEVHEPLLIEELGPGLRPLWLDEDAFTRELMSCAAGVLGEPVGRAAVVNHRGVYRTELPEIRSSFARQGVDCRLLDAAELIDPADRRAGPQLVYNKVDPLAVARDPRLREYLTMQASSAVCSINPLVAQYVTEDKRALALLSDPHSPLDLAPEQRRALDRHLPWTRLLHDGEITTPEGEQADPREFARRSRDGLVLKRGNSTHGQGTTIGRLVPPEHWASLVDSAARAGDAVLQQYEPLPTEQVLDPRLIAGGESFVGLDSFLFGGEVVGMRGRAAQDELLPVGRSGVVRPVLVGPAAGRGPGKAP